MIQSSGCGKSRFLKEVGKKAFVFYICLNQFEYSEVAYPPRSVCVNRIFDRPNTSDEGFFKGFFLSCLELLDKYFAYHEKEYRLVIAGRVSGSTAAEGSRIWSDFIGLQFDVILRYYRRAYMGEIFWRGVKEQMKTVTAPEEFEHKLKSFTMLCRYRVPVLFAFDEAAMLLKLEDSEYSCKEADPITFKTILRAL